MQWEKYHTHEFEIFVRKDTKGDKAIANEVLVNDTYRLQDKVRSFLNNPKVILDIGAHIGTCTILMKKIWSDAKIICVEPHNESFMLLKRNVENLPDVHCLHGAVWYGKGPFHLSERFDWNIGGCTVLDDHWKGDKVQKKIQYNIRCLTVEEILDAFEIENVDLAKWDCEKGEIIAFENMEEKTLKKFGCMVGEYHFQLQKFETLALKRFADHQWTFQRNRRQNLGLFWARKENKFKPL